MVLSKTTQVLLLCSVALSFSTAVNAKPIRHQKAFTSSYATSDATEFSSRKRTRVHQGSYRTPRAYHARRTVRLRTAQHPTQIQQSYGFGELPDRHAVGETQYYPTNTYVSTSNTTRAPRRVRTVSRVADRTNSYASTGGSVGGSSIIAEARRYLGGNPTGRSSLWCATFMNFVLERTGHKGTGSNLARSFASYGTRVSGPQVGAIAVMSRGRNGGHVGIVSGIDGNGNPIIISGNHGRRVAEATYQRGRIYAYVLP